MGVIVSFIYDKTELNLFINSFSKLERFSYQNAVKVYTEALPQAVQRPPGAPQLRPLLCSSQVRRSLSGRDPVPAAQELLQRPCPLLQRLVELVSWIVLWRRWWWDCTTKNLSWLRRATASGCGTWAASATWTCSAALWPWAWATATPRSTRLCTSRRKSSGTPPASTCTRATMSKPDSMRKVVIWY